MAIDTLTVNRATNTVHMVNLAEPSDAAAGRTAAKAQLVEAIEDALLALDDCHVRPSEQYRREVVPASRFAGKPYEVIHGGDQFRRNH
ncbi:MAG: hypothetical protein WCA17_10655 [Burkholderiales bacterium]